VHLLIYFTNAAPKFKTNKTLHYFCLTNTSHSISFGTNLHVVFIYTKVDPCALLLEIGVKLKNQVSHAN